jgi:hypothetical protein
MRLKVGLPLQINHVVAPDVMPHQRERQDQSTEVMIDTSGVPRTVVKRRR